MFNGKIHYVWPFSIVFCMFTRGQRRAIDGTDGPFTVGAPGTISVPWTKDGWCGSKKYGNNHRCPKFPLVGWLKTRGLFTSLTTGFYDDRWYTSHRPLYFYQKDIFGINIQKDCVKFLCCSENYGYNLGFGIPWCGIKIQCFRDYAGFGRSKVNNFERWNGMWNSHLRASCFPFVTFLWSYGFLMAYFIWGFSKGI